MISVPLYPTDGTVPAGTPNGTYLRDLLLQMFSSSFANLAQPQLSMLISQMFANCKDQAAFKQHLRDFLVQLKEFGDSAELYAEEQQVGSGGRPRRSPRDPQGAPPARGTLRQGLACVFPWPQLTLLLPCAPFASPCGQADIDVKALEMRKRQEAVPGLLNPHVRQDDMDM